MSSAIEEVKLESLTDSDQSQNYDSKRSKEYECLATPSDDNKKDYECPPTPSDDNKKDFECPPTPSDDSSNSSTIETLMLAENSIINLDIIKEEERLAKENEALRKKEFLELERKRMREEAAKEEEALAKQREAEQRERRYKRLMHLLKNSKMYSSMLKDKIETGKVEKEKSRSRKKKTTDFDTLKENNNKKRKRIEQECDINDALEGKDHPMDFEFPEDNEPERLVLPQKDFFSKTKRTSSGFTVSEFQPKLFEGGVMRDYQLQGLEWLNVLFTNAINGILADEMGLGKTIQVIAFICSLIEQGIEGPFLIIAPLSCIPNWVSEFKRFAPKVPVLMFHGYQDVRKALIPQLLKKFTVLNKRIHQVIITSYEVPLSEKKALSSIRWHYVIVDEGHRIKNHNSQLSRALREYDTIGRLLLTGTPLHNNLYELWSLLNFLLPEVFNALDVFESWFDVTELESNGAKFMEEKLNVQVVSTLQQILTPFMLRREKKDVNLNLPPKKEILTYCPLLPFQKELYQATVDRTIDRLLNPKKPPPGVILEPSAKRQCVLNRKPIYDFADDPDDDPIIIEPEKEFKEKCLEYALDIVMQNPQMQLRKIVNHPYLIRFPLIKGTRELRIDEELIKSSGKLMVLDAMLAKLKERGHKVVIFSTFTSLLDILEEHAIIRNYRYCRLDGRIKSEIRTDSIHEFNNNPDVFVFYVSIRAGGLGINLTAADTVILYDSDWNPQVNLQAQDRCHRIGQTKPVVVYTFCTYGTIDEKIIERGNAKRRLERMIIQKGTFTGASKEAAPKLSLMDVQNLKKLLESTSHDTVIHSNGFVFSDEELDRLLDRSDMTAETTSDEDKENQVFQVLDKKS